MSNDKIPARLLSAVYQGKRSLGRPNTSVRHFMLNDVGKIIPEVDFKGSFSSWAYIAHYKVAWQILINNLGSNFFNLPLNGMVILLIILIILILPFFLIYQIFILLQTRTKLLEPHYKFLPLPLLHLLPPHLPSFQTYSPRLKTIFRILNLNLTWSLREVRTAYYLLARKYHPDKCNGEISTISKAESAELFKGISNIF